MALLIIYVLIALGFSFLCSLLESTLLTVTPSKIESAKAAGLPWGPRMEKLKDDIDRPLSAILTLNTIAHTMGAAGAGAQYARIYGNAGEAIFAGALTLAILIVTEIIPKTLGARYALFFAPSVSWLLPWLIRLLGPLVWLCKQITRVITRGDAEHPHTNREELLAMANLGEEEGIIAPQERTVFQNLLQLNAVHVENIMTPRPVVFMLPQNTTGSEFVAIIKDKPFSRIPIFGRNRDDVNGFVVRAEVLYRCATEGEDFHIEALSRPILVTPEKESVAVLFRRLSEEKTHIMLATDEFGSATGVVTFEDVIETVLGIEIVDENDRHQDLQAVARSLWRTRAERMGIALDEAE
ncbi:hemolysin family protein [Cerasicoccus maritimus]|uniref:hemolysin family protein n=1 Tax=Cerasicoccus maritimus TaxID=490089 RepID=UPI002852A0C8|nr:hemolysin family protein [Cerasicoccus maritimus]